MKTICIQVSKSLYDELLDAAALCAKDDEAPCSPEDFARECVECVLAARRSLKLRRPRKARMAENPERAVRVGHFSEMQEMTA